MSLDNPRTRAIVSLLYVIGAVVVLNEIAEWTISVWPLNFSLKNWRFGSVGLVAARLPDIMIGFTMIIAGAALLGHQTVLRVLGVLQMVAAVVLLGLVGSFALDATELRLQVQPTARRAFYLASGKAAGFMLIAIGVLLRAGWVCFRANASGAVKAAASRASRGESGGSGERSAAPGLVFSTSSTEK